MSEHQGSSSPEETSSEHDSASVTSFDDGEPNLPAYPHLKEAPIWPRPAADDETSPIFAYSLLSACSAQGRAVSMCQYARTITSQDMASSAKGTIGLRGKDKSSSCRRFLARWGALANWTLRTPSSQRPSARVPPRFPRCTIDTIWRGLADNVHDRAAEP